MLGLVTCIYIWRSDIGLSLAGWTSVACLGALLIAWRLQGNLLSFWLNNLNDPNTKTALWWFQPILCVVVWVVPLGVIGFIGHTFRLIWKEIQAPDL
jgi:hypothetical protein